jgi:cob(I)alamin adenosyltransferase
MARIADDAKLPAELWGALADLMGPVEGGDLTQPLNEAWAAEDEQRTDQVFGARHRSRPMSAAGTEIDVNQAHREKMARIKAVKDRIYASKTIEKGLLIVHTGTGKGKSTAAWGLAMRTLGHGRRLGVVQFVKGRRETGERFFLARFPELVEVKVMGEGFTWETQDRERDIAAARAAWAETLRMLADPDLHLVILDELNIVLRKDYLPVDEVVNGLLGKRPDLHVVVTGRNAKPELLEAADLVTEMTLVKHPFRSGVKAQLGIEY